MRYTEYGKSGKLVSSIGFGGMRFSEPKEIDAMAEIVVHAYRKGINYFDTAPGYCDDASEIIMGRALKQIAASGNELPYYVSSKSMKADGTQLREDLERSLTRLGVDSIDFYHCWYLLHPDDLDKRRAGGAIDQLLKAREEGLIKHLCFSTHLPGERIAEVIDTGLFEGVLLGYSAANHRYRQKGIEAATENDLGVVVMNPLGGGSIVGNEKAFSYLKVRETQSMLDAALHFLLDESRINVSLVGFRSIDDVDTAVASMDSFSPYTNEERQRVTQGSLSSFDALCTGCMYCRDCPVDIPVWKFVETANLLLLESQESVRGRLKYHWGVSIDELDACIECGACERACTQSLPILKRFEQLKEAVTR